METTPPVTHELPLPPLTWHKAAGQYREIVKMLAKCDRARVQRGPVVVTVRIYRERKHGDLSTMLTLLLEAIQGVFYERNSQIRELHAILEDDRHRPRVELTVKEVMPQKEQFVKMQQ